MLVHPKYKRTPLENAGVVYQVPCKECPSVHMGETERMSKEREKEHKQYVRSLEEVKFIQARKNDCF